MSWKRSEDGGLDFIPNENDSDINENDSDINVYLTLSACTYVTDFIDNKPRFIKEKKVRNVKNEIKDRLKNRRYANSPFNNKKKY